MSYHSHQLYFNDLLAIPAYLHSVLLEQPRAAAIVDHFVHRLEDLALVASQPVQYYPADRAPTNQIDYYKQLRHLFCNKLTVSGRWFCGGAANGL